MRINHSSHQNQSSKFSTKPNQQECGRSSHIWNGRFCIYAAMGKRRRMLEADDIAVALKVSKEKYHGQDPQPAITYPDGEYIRGSQSIKSIGTRLAKLLLSFYKKRPEWPMAICEQTTGKMVQMEQADELVQEPQMAQQIV